MSARHYLSAREKNNCKLVDCLPNINQQKFGYRTGSELPALSANTSLVNRNINYTYEPFDSGERAGTPFSDFFSESETGESETGTPDFRSEESDSSAGSALRRNTAEASKTLAEEWERIERTLYNEDGEKTTRPQILEECKQWIQLHPQLRIIGKAIPLPEKRLCYRQIEHDEVIAIHYSDYEQFSESEERLSQSSTDVTPQNSPRVSISEETFEPKLSRERVSFFPTYEEPDLPDSFCSFLQITPLQIRSPSHRKRPNHNILRSDLASSRWMRSSRPDSSVNGDRNSAKSFVSLDTRNHGNLALSASDRNKLYHSRVVTARYRDLGRLEPLCSPELQQNDMSRIPNGILQQYSTRKVSLPPLLLEEEKKKVVVGSAKKYNTKIRKTAKNVYQFDKFKH